VPKSLWADLDVVDSRSVSGDEIRQRRVEGQPDGWTYTLVWVAM
jgi:hypothetical protein